MSTPAPSDPSNPRAKSRRINLGRYVKRMSSVFRRGKSSKRGTSPTPASSTPRAEQQPQTAEQETAKEDVAREEATVKEVAQEEVTVEEAPKEDATSGEVAVATTPAITQTKHTVPTPPAHPLALTVIQQERARAIFAKHGFTFDSFPSEPISISLPAPNIERVEKLTRMRIHRSCHHCGTMFGSEKTCLECTHTRCKKCPRYPEKKKSPDTKGKGKERPTQRPRHNKLLPTTATSRSGNDPAPQLPKQRVRRTCHRCDTVFIPHTSTTCTQCLHTRCTKCPREPAKRNKWPAGYPGDAKPDSDSEAERQLERFRRAWRKPRMRVRWECEECHKLFEEGETNCDACGHERCVDCVRDPPSKTREEEPSDPDVVAAVEAKLKAMALDTDSHAKEERNV